MMKLYSYYRSSAAFRARIALNLKGLDYELIPIHLLKEGGAQHSASYKALNPQELIPALEHNGQIITQSLAIVEYLDELYPNPPLLPVDPLERAQVRALSLSIACDIHPLQNLRVLRYLTNDLHIEERQKDEWIRHWISVGFDALEKQLSTRPHTPCAFGEQPTMLDICLVPQVTSARRFHVDLAAYPRIVEIEQHCLTLPAFDKALPANQPDMEM